jgi:hypothetical protein
VTYNPDQLDTDGDSQGNACDPCPFDANNDIDNDGLCANNDNCDYDHNPLQEDCDNDGKGNACPNEDLDLDGDGIPNAVDVCDLTPSGYAVFPAGHALQGTVAQDVDGDCDVDANDVSAVQAFPQYNQPNLECGNGGNHRTYPTCP